MQNRNRIRENLKPLAVAAQAQSGPQEGQVSEEWFCEMARRWPADYAVSFFAKRPILDRLERQMARAFLDGLPWARLWKHHSAAWRRKKAREISAVDGGDEAGRAFVKRLAGALNTSAAILDILTGRALCVHLAVSAPKTPFLN